ncbi:MAG: hypothetical protein M1819_004041 [Sarea resinae]|nr:MAG: hypothetical protein M1819_004041 [Sarea resinae]
MDSPERSLFFFFFFFLLPGKIWLRAHSPVVIALLAGIPLVAAQSTQPVGSSSSPRPPWSQSLEVWRDILRGHLRSASDVLQQTHFVATSGQSNTRLMVQALALCSFVPGLWLLKHRWSRNKFEQDSDSSQRKSYSSDVRSQNFAARAGNEAASTDPSLLKKHTTYESYTTPIRHITYPSIRTFYRPHPQAERLPSKPSPIPLLVFIHGLGGCLAQFHPLLTSLCNLAPCLGIDLPGCGLSKFAPREWEAYSTEALVELLATVIEQHRDKDNGQGVVLIGHSMGCSLAVLLASTTSPHPSCISEHVVALVNISPKAYPPSEKQVEAHRKVLSVPTPIFDIWRQWDRRGGTESASVARFVGPNADPETKKLQLRFNAQSKTAVWRRMAWGCLPRHVNGVAKGGLPGEYVWRGVQIPTFCVTGEADKITSPDELKEIAKYFGNRSPSSGDITPSDAIPDSAAPVDAGLVEKLAREGLSAQTRVETKPVVEDPPTEKHSRALSGPAWSSLPSDSLIRWTVVPAPAAHALLYTPAISRTLAGLISSFLHRHVDARLSLGWQLQHLTTEGKWDVKNLAKWQAVTPVSEPIAGAFRAMKTLREVDERHSPGQFVREWRGKIGAVVDISHESPVYDPEKLERGGIAYHKFPTVSKIPPTLDEVKDFILLIDNLRRSLGQLDSSNHDGTQDGSRNQSFLEGDHSPPVIGVHCHYGFNRTGFFIVCYLVERMGFGVQAALNAFEKSRPPGIRHEHFIDTLFMRYCVGLKRTPTL